MPGDKVSEALLTLENYIKENLEKPIEGAERYKTEEAGFALIVIKHHLHPECVAPSCDWSGECAHKARYGQNPDSCPFRT